MVPGQIPWHYIVDYAGFYGLDEEVTRIFVRVIRAMDIAYLQWVAKRPKTNGS